MESDIRKRSWREGMEFDIIIIKYIYIYIAILIIHYLPYLIYMLVIDIGRKYVRIYLFNKIGAELIPTSIIIIKSNMNTNLILAIRGQ